MADLWNDTWATMRWMASLADGIKASVGRRNGVECFNVPDDQLVVINALNAIGPLNGGTSANPLPTTGIAWGRCGDRLAAAILAFQQNQTGLSVDGHVDPGGQTIARLLLLSTPDTPFVPAPFLKQTVMNDLIVRITGGQQFDIPSATPFMQPGAVDYARLSSPTRRLFRIFNSAGTAEQMSVNVPTLLAKIMATLATPSDDPNVIAVPGVVFMHGSSIGGVVVLRLAHLVSVAKVTINYIGLADAAFFDRDTVNDPIDLGNNVPGNNPLSVCPRSG